MEYTVQKLADMAGVSARTIRFYDEIGLLPPSRVSEAGYRLYGRREVDALQQILFFRALGLDLKTIAAMMQDASFNRLEALFSHLEALQAQKARIDRLIDTVQKTIQKEEGKITMTDQEKFEGLKKRLLDENERKYGAQARENYGEEAVASSNAHWMGLTKEQYEAMEETGGKLQSLLEVAVRAGDAPDGPQGEAAARLHKAWLGATWPRYTPQAHKGLGDTYICDERFTAHYDKSIPGCAGFLRDAIHAWADRI